MNRLEQAIFSVRLRIIPYKKFREGIIPLPETVVILGLAV
jgi:hypothetical protein